LFVNGDRVFIGVTVRRIISELVRDTRPLTLRSIPLPKLPGSGINSKLTCCALCREIAGPKPENVIYNIAMGNAYCEECNEGEKYPFSHDSNPFREVGSF